MPVKCAADLMTIFSLRNCVSILVFLVVILKYSMHVKLLLKLLGTADAESFQIISILLWLNPVLSFYLYVLSTL